MSKKPSPRKKARPASKRRMTFRISVEAQPMVVTYEPNWMRDMALFEFRSPHKPPKRIPVSETGYRSHYAAMDEVQAAKSPQDFARDEALALLRYGMKGYGKEANELPLF